MDDIVYLLIYTFLFFALLTCGKLYEANLKEECAKQAIEKQYSASDIQAICFK